MLPAPPANRRNTIAGSFVEQNDEPADDSLAAGFIALRRSVSDSIPPNCSYSDISSASALSPDSNLPPSYEDEGLTLPPARFKISPREEEGREELPSYTCSLHKEAVFERKLELRSPFQRAESRRWKKCYFILHGTLLSIYTARRAQPFANQKDFAKDGRPIGWEPGELLTKYTLQLAEVGVAADYRKRHFVLRVRAQTEQFLFSCRNLDSYVEWLEAISTAIDLSPALEERSLPRYQTIPRRRRRRAPVLLREQEAVFRQDFPHLVDSTTSSLTARNALRPRRYAMHDESMSSDVAALRGEMAQSGFISSSSIPTPPRSVAPARTQATRCPSASPQVPMAANGKWAPPRTLTNEANLRYAKRCMAVLCSDSPRQSEFVIVDGKRYRICWDKQEMTPMFSDDAKVTTTSEDRAVKFSCPSLMKLVRFHSRNSSKGKDKVQEIVDGSSKGKLPLPRLPEYEEIVETPSTFGRGYTVMLH